MYDVMYHTDTNYFLIMIQLQHVTCIPAPLHKVRPLTSRESQQQRDGRLDHAKTRRIRKLCGWNVFQRSQFEGVSVPKGEWKAKQQEVSRQWKAMSAEERNGYEIHAQAEQAKIDALASTPLPSKQQSLDADDTVATEDGVWRNAAKKVSCRRLTLNTEAFGAHSLWELPTQLGDGALAGLIILK